MQKYNTYLIFGAPGSGKGTQGSILGQIPRFYHFACGEVFRALDTRTPVGKAFLEYSSRGELVPDEITISLWKARISDHVESHLFKPDLDILILDGIPRNIGQAQIMKDIIHVRKIFHLVVPDRAKLITRMKRRAVKENRLDDAKDSVIIDRLETYEAQTMPLLDFYGRDLVVEIDALKPPVAVLSEILQVITKDGAGLMPEQQEF
jgi:adenylate kinase